MKATHRKKIDARRLHHQKTQKQKKMDAIKDSINCIHANGYDFYRANMFPAMHSRNYFWTGGDKKIHQDDLKNPSNWQKIPSAKDSHKPKVFIDSKKRMKTLIK